MASARSPIWRKRSSLLQNAEKDLLGELERQLASAGRMPAEDSSDGDLGPSGHDNRYSSPTQVAEKFGLK
jgi:hypothetical protein